MKFPPEYIFRISKTGLALCAAAALSGCVVMGLEYDEDFSQIELETVKIGRVTMGLPAGWEPDSGGASSDRVAAAFVNKETGGYGEVKCYSVLVGFGDMQRIGKDEGLQAAGADPEYISGPWSLGSTQYARTFDVYTGTVTRKGKEAHVTSYSGYNINTALSPCYATVLLVTPEQYDREFNPVFAAMLDSIVTR
jgi:hypothetical protein